MADDETKSFRDLDVLSLLNLWQAGYAAGRPPAAEDLCPNDPKKLAELRRCIAAVEKIRALAATTTATETVVPQQPVRSDCVPDLPGYDSFEPLGRGAMGVVYKARQTVLNRTVAVKVLPDDRTTALARLRFLLEAEALAAVDHQHVVKVLTFGQQASLPYLVMEFCPGGTLEALLGKNRLPPGDAAELMRSVAVGVAAMHDAGIIHRDLKPGNVLFDAAGRPKVADFGLAKRGSGADLTGTGAVMGTPAYMAPEQARGGSKFVDPTTDVWALGVILYEALTGRRPFNGPDTIQVLMSIQSDEPPAVRSLSKEVPRDLELICHKCLRKDTRDRYARAELLAADLARFLNGEPVLARRTRAAEQLWRWVKRHPGRAGATAAVGLILVAAPLALELYALVAALAVLAGIVPLAAALYRQRGVADAARLEAEARRDEIECLLNAVHAEKVEAEGARAELVVEKHRLEVAEYGHTIQLAHQATRDTNFALARLLLDRTPAELRGWEYYHVHRVCFSEVWTRTRATEDRGGQADSPDGTRTVTVTGDAVVKVVNRETGATLARSAGDPATGWPGTFSKDGRRLVTGRGEAGAAVIDAASGELVAELEGHTDWVIAGAFTADGRRVATASRDGSARVYDTETGTLLAAFYGHGGEVVAVEFNPAGDRVVTASADGTARVWNPDTGQEIHNLAGHSAAVTDAEFSPDGRHVLTAGEDGTARLWDGETGALRAELRGHRAGVLAAVFDPAGDRIVTASRDKTAAVWDVATGRRVVPLRGHTAGVTSAVFNDEIVVTASWDGTVRFWNADRANAVVDGPRHDGGVLAAAFSPDGGRVVSAGEDGAAVIWDANTGRVLRTLDGHTDRVVVAVFSPDGTRVLTAGGDATARVWDAASGEPVGPPVRHENEISVAAFSPDGRRIASGEMGPTVRLWEAASGRVPIVLGEAAGTVSAIRFRPDGKQLVAGTWAGGLRLVDLAEDGPVEDLAGHTRAVTSICFAPDGRRFATASRDGTARVWCTDGTRLPALLGHTGIVWRVAFGPSGRELVTVSDDKTVRVWDAGTGACLRELHGHTAGVWAVEFSPDGRRILSASADGTVRVWDSATGYTLAELKDASAAVHVAAFSTDGSRVLTAGADGTPRVYHTAAVNMAYTGEAARVLGSA